MDRATSLISWLSLLPGDGGVVFRGVSQPINAWLASFVNLMIAPCLMSGGISQPEDCLHPRK